MSIKTPHEGREAWVLDGGKQRKATLYSNGEIIPTVKTDICKRKLKSF